MIIYPLPQDAITPEQTQALKNIILYDFGMTPPTETQLQLNGYDSLDHWYLRKFNDKAGMHLENLNQLDKVTASRLIEDLLQ